MGHRIGHRTVAIIKGLKGRAQADRRRRTEEAIAGAIAGGTSPEERQRREDLLQGASDQVTRTTTINPGGRGERTIDIPLSGKRSEAIIAQATRTTQTRDAVQGRRKKLKLQGARSTRRSRSTPDLFASSLGSPRQLLGS